MGNLIRTIGYQKTNEPVLNKATAILSDGVTRVVIASDTNQTGVTGDGGDNTGIPKYYVYTSTDGVNWTLRQTIALASATGTRPSGSFSIGANDNIHLVYRAADLSIKYQLLTRSGVTWTVGGVESIIAAAAASEGYVRLDIDVAGTGNNAVITVMHSRTIATQFYKMLVFVRTNTPAWVAATAQSVWTSDYPLEYTDEMNMACDQTAIGGDFLTTACVAITRKGKSGTDSGDWVYVMRINVSTGAVQQFKTHTTSLNSGRGGGFRRTRVFNDGTDTYWLAGLCDADDTQFFLYRLQITNRSTLNSTTLMSTTRYRPGSVAGRTISYFQWTDVAYCGNGKFIFLKHDPYRDCVVASVNTSDYSVVWSPEAHFEGTYVGATSNVSPVYPAQMWIGTPRNYSASLVPTLTNFYFSGGINAYRLEAYDKPNPVAGSMVSPGNGSSMITDRPILKGTLVLPVNEAPIRCKLQFQLATDAGFTTNVRTVTEPDTDLQYPKNTANGAVVTAEEAVTLAAELFQATWFVRVRTTDEVGAFGPYSSATSFAVSHQAVPANLSPTGGGVFQYGTGAVTFSWTFTDPSPGDTQTAYQVVVSNADTGAVVVDSTKITSTASQATLTIPAGSKDANLQWVVTLWDSDNVAGIPSDPQLFIVTDPPAPIITTPTTGQVLASANPTITWSTGLTGIKTQSASRVMITNGGTTVYDSGWITSGQNSRTIPTGYLSNLTAYTVQVWIRDNFNIEGTDTETFSTNWTPPTTRSLQSIYLSEYSKRGYVYITFDPTTFDSDFLAWKIYRRPYGTSDWTNIAYLHKTSDILAFKDYTAASGVTYQYTITQVADRFGDYVESTAGTIMTVTPQADGYWIVHQTDDSLSFPLYSVVDDSFSEEYESETYHVIGRGRHVDYGDRLGYTGTMECQLRDRALTGVARTNWVINPALTFMDPGPTPFGWTLVTGGTVGTVSEDYVQTQDPPPTNVDAIYRVLASGLGTATTDFARVEQLIVLDPTVVTGDTCSFSIWVNDVQGILTQRRIEIGMQWETSGASVVRNDTSSAPTAIATYTSNAAGTPDFGSTSNPVTGQWKRYAITNTVPATATQVRVRVLMAGNGTGSAGARSLIVTGAQFEEGSPSNYFDGRQLGASWIGTEDKSASFTSGYITARAQRLRLEAMKAEKTAVFLRSPFGEIFSVAVGDIGVKRIPGTGTTEITDVTIPYQEVAF